MPKRPEAQVIGGQILRSGTSPGANYYEGCHARSRAEFISKMEIGLQEIAETIYWLELLVEAEILAEALLIDLLSEANELKAILIASILKSKRGLARK